MPTSYTDFVNEARKLYTADLEKAKADNTTFYAGQTDSANKLYDARVDKTNKSYEDDYRVNAVQKLINERQVAENMANLGLTDSGLNRTQQTAVQLSYANQKANLDRQKQSAIEDINLARTQALDTIEQNRMSSEASIDQEYNKLINEAATTNYGNYLDYISEQNKISQEATEKNSYIIKTKNGLLSRDYEGSLKENGVDSYKITKNGKDYIRYVDNKSGNSVELEVGVNPYTGDDNSDKTRKDDTALAHNAYGAYGNGYQPKGVYENGIDYGSVSNSGIKAYINGNEQRVHVTTKNGTNYWVWDGKNNKYIKYKSEHSGYGIYGVEEWSDDEWYSYFYKGLQKYNKESMGTMYKSLKPFMSENTARRVGQMLGRANS